MEPTRSSHPTRPTRSRLRLPPSACRVLGTLAVTGLLLGAPGAQAAPVSTSAMRIAITFRHDLILLVPSAWQPTVVSQPGLSTTLKLVPPKGSNQAFQILVTTMPITAPRQIDLRGATRRLVAVTIDTARKRAVEPELELIDLNGPRMTGAYYRYTDRIVEPDGFRYVTTGTAVVGNTLTTFTVLANSDPEPIVDEALKMMRSAGLARVETAGWPAPDQIPPDRSVVMEVGPDAKDAATARVLP